MHITAMPLDTKPGCKTRRRIGRTLRCEKDPQTISLKLPHRGSRRQAPIAAEADAGNLDPVQLDNQWRWWVEASDRMPTQSHDVTPILAADTFDANLPQFGSADDEPASAARPDK